MSPREIELKLSVAAEDMDRLRKLPVLSPDEGKPTAKLLDSLYFDTADRRLQAHGLSLRVRRQGKKLVQTLKSAPPPGVGALVRGEWEVPVTSPRPDLAALPDPAVLAPLGPLTADELEPVFETRIRRQVRLLTPAPGVRIEVAIDQGEIVTPAGASLPINELELELVEGEDTLSLYNLARTIHAALPVRLEMETKSARGYALADGGSLTTRKADKLTLEKDTTVEEALASVVRHCLTHMLANQAAALAGEDPEGVHQMRVALRRLRSSFQIFRPFIPADQQETLVPGVKWLAGSLGAAREWDVFLGELLPPVTAVLPGHPGLVALEKAAQDAHAAGYKAVRDAILSPRYTSLLLELAAWVDGRGWRNQPVSERSALLLRPVSEMAGALLTKRYKQARRRGRGFAHAEPAERHELRIALKKLRYAADFFRSLFDQRAVRRFLEDLSGLQDKLGHLQDVATVTKLMRELEDTATGPATKGWQHGAGLVTGWHARGLHDMESGVVEDWRRFADTKPFWREPAENTDGATLI
ncbi:MULTISPECIES: CYTH and CHAD domain-containing protein [unclassified Azospirillum]|uniref:CYTH and CHAD domain-containing protein n=1 Tax=unclassified Azospirillum TaxID=2630922 RepID=UPI000B65DAEE|nr:MULTISPECIES: CYTH and CHAD domain-containing protein [unclassified Azospirillum]SNS17157.1 Inorganic triphosphatase YgiF, contains CYTH and CHAD domains [Azospirillum sp. RU38E]SNS34461.1 Inorganic triphosphatase YgiF, contains CYTH and CHAD domains [Azospirillum sp. RU37A]